MESTPCKCWSPQPRGSGGGSGGSALPAPPLPEGVKTLHPKPSARRRRGPAARAEAAGATAASAETASGARSRRTGCIRAGRSGGAAARGCRTAAAGRLSGGETLRRPRRRPPWDGAATLPGWWRPYPGGRVDAAGKAKSPGRGLFVAAWLQQSRASPCALCAGRQEAAGWN